MTKGYKLNRPKINWFNQQRFAGCSDIRFFCLVAKTCKYTNDRRNLKNHVIIAKFIVMADKTPAGVRKVDKICLKNCHW